MKMRKQSVSQIRVQFEETFPEEDLQKKPISKQYIKLATELMWYSWLTCCRVHNLVEKKPYG